MSAIQYQYQTMAFGSYHIHFRSLKDRLQFEDDNGEAEDLGISSASWPIAGMVWPSGEVLAELMASYDVDNRRILEIGCGIGLASLVLNERLADITASDIHPSADANLQHNAQLNNKRAIPFLRSSWDDDRDLSFGDFDLIIGSDLLYERDHFESLANVIKNYAKQECEVIVIDAGRGYGRKFTTCMEELGFVRNQLESSVSYTEPEKYKGKIFRYCRA